jgi:hypothetical protein
VLCFTNIGAGTYVPVSQNLEFRLKRFPELCQVDRAIKELHNKGVVKRTTVFFFLLLPSLSPTNKKVPSINPSRIPRALK